MINLYTKKFGLSSLGAAMIIAGIVVKNTHEQMKSTDNILPMVGMGIFVLGLVVTVFSCTLNNIENPKLKAPRSIMAIISAIFIILAVMAMKGIIKLPGAVPKAVLAGVFGLAWIILGYSLGLKHYGTDVIEVNKNTMAGVGGAALIILSMLIVLPWQRIKGIVDGPGMPLFVAGLGGIILGNAMK